MGGFFRGPRWPQGGSAAGLIRLLVVDGEVEEGDLGGAGVASRGASGRLGPPGAAAHRQVSGQRDLDLKPHLPVLRRPGRDQRAAAEDRRSAASPVCL